MMFSEMAKKALIIAFNAHNGQYDKSGVPYIFHPYEVARYMNTEEEIITALLHDVVEDTNIKLNDLSDAGFSNNVIEALKLLTHDENVPYLEYVKHIKINPLAQTVKLADLKHNSDIGRIKEPNEWDYQRIEKYKKAIKILEE